MNEQEMQFADPDWQPLEPLPLVQEHILAEIPMAAPACLEESTARRHTTERSYRGEPQPAHVPVQCQQARYLPGSSEASMRRRVHWWIGVLILIVCASLVAGVASARLHARLGDAGRSAMSSQEAGTQNYTYAAGDVYGIAIVNSSGSITVRAADSNTDTVHVQTNGVRPEISSAEHFLLITAADHDTDLVVTLPRNLALKLSTNAGNIEVDGFSGQLSARTITGTITLNSDTLSGLSRIRSEGSGTIRFTGLLDPWGAYQFSSEAGDIDLTLPGNAAVRVQHLQESGNYSSDFPAWGDAFPRAFLLITSRGGNIALHKS